MKNIKHVKLLFIGLFFSLFLPIVVEASQINGLPSGWNSESHTSLVSKVQEIRGFLFSTPVMIMAVFAVAMAIYHTFREGSVMPLLTVMGIIILTSLVPFVLDILHPVNASGMTIDDFMQLTVSLINQ